MFGAWIFQLLEGKIFLETKAKQLQNIARDSQLYSEYVWNLIKQNPELQSQDAIEKIRFRSVEKFENVSFITRIQYSGDSLKAKAFFMNANGKFLNFHLRIFHVFRGILRKIIP